LRQNEGNSGFLGQKSGFLDKIYLLKLPSLVSLKEALSLNDSSITSRLPPVVLCLTFLIITSLSLFHILRGLRTLSFGEGEREKRFNTNKTTHKGTKTRSKREVNTLSRGKGERAL
jgi:hypothetical protein